MATLLSGLALSSQPVVARASAVWAPWAPALGDADEKDCTQIPLDPKEYGVDVALPAGTPVYAPGPGTILQWSPTPKSPPYIGNWQPGRVLEKLDTGAVVGFGHVNTPVVAVGARVNGGQQITTIGNNSWNSQGSHTEFMYSSTGRHAVNTDFCPPMPKPTLDSYMAGIPPGNPATGPVATSRGAGYTDVLFHGTDNQIYHYWWVNGAFAGSELVPGITLSPGSSVGAVGNAPDPLDIFVRGTDGLLYASHMSSNGVWAGWTQYLSAHLAANTSPVATSRGAGYTDVLFHGTDDHIYHYWWVNGAFAGSELVPGITLSPGSSLGAVGNAPDPLDVFAQGTDGLLYGSHMGSNGVWAGWTQSPSAQLAANTGPDATSRGAGYTDVLFHGTDNHIYHYWWVNGALAGSELVPGITLSPGSSVGAVGNAPDPLDIFARGTDGLLYASHMGSNGVWSGWKQYPSAHLA
jgi:Peptidase family M23